MSAARLFGNMKVTAKAANAGICSRCSNGFTEGLCSAVVVDVLKSQTYAIMLVVPVSPSLIATSKIPAFGHGLLLDNAMRCDAKDHQNAEGKGSHINAKRLARRC